MSNLQKEEKIRCRSNKIEKEKERKKERKNKQNEKKGLNAKESICLRYATVFRYKSNSNNINNVSEMACFTKWP